MEVKIYLRREEIPLGCGSTAKYAVAENYYQVTEVDENHVKLCLLDFTDQPFGKGVVISKSELANFIPCPDYFKQKRKPRDLLIEKHVQSGDRHYEKREFYSAEYEYNQALALDRRHLRAHLGKGKTLYARGEIEAARKIFSTLSQLETLYDKENKHIFNEFGIELRKKGMFEEAISNYLKAISIDPGDEVLYYNLGRAYYEEGKFEEALGQLKKALTLKPDFEDAREFLSQILSSTLKEDQDSVSFHQTGKNCRTDRQK